MKGPELAVVGVGVAACVACCAGPIIGVLGGIGALGLLSTMFLGAAGILIAVAAFAAVFVVRRRVRGRPADDGPVPVEFTRRRS